MDHPTSPSKTMKLVDAQSCVKLRLKIETIKTHNIRLTYNNPEAVSETMAFRNHQLMT